jgi:uncharacterized protein GlcG (DUF336 family)
MSAPFDIPYGAPIKLDSAQNAIMAAVTEAKERNWKMAIAVVGPAGQLVAHATIDGTRTRRSRSRRRRHAPPRGSASEKLLADAINGGTPATLSLPALTHGVASEGGLPIVVDGKPIGAIGASGGTAPQDGVVAKAGLDAGTPH